MTEDTPSRSYVLKEGGFRDPIGEAVLNAGRKGEMGEGVGNGLNGKRRRQKPPDQQEDARPTPLPMPGSFPLTQTQTQTTRQPPYLPLPHPIPNANTNPHPNPFPTPQLILPSMLPPPPPIQIPEMQPLPKFQPVPEPIWERPSGGKSEAERFKEQYMGGVARVEGNGVPEGARRRRRKGRKEEVLDVAGGGARVGDGLSNQTQTQTQMQLQLQTQSQTQAQTQNQPSDPPAPPNPRLTSKEERHQLRRQKRRSRAAAAAGLADLAGTGAGAGPGEQDPPAIRRGGRLGRGASMRRRNVWDDVPEFANPNEQISSPPHPIPTVQEEEEDPIHHPHSHSLTLTEPAPPPFPYPTTGTGRLPPPFDVNVHGAEGPVQMGRWSPPPPFEEVVNAREADNVQQEAEEEDDGEEEIPPSPSTTSSVQAERIRRESPRERRKREERERWVRQRETGVDLEIMVGREKERIQRMGHWDALMGSRNQTRETLVPPDNEGGLEVQEMRDGEAGSANEVIKEEGRYSKEEKGKGRAIYYDAPDRALGEDVPGPGVSRASSISTNVGTALEEPHEDEQEESKTYPTVHRVQLADDQVGEGSKVSGFVMRELVAAGIDLSEIVPEQEEEQEVDLPPSSTRENAGSPTTPKANAQPLTTPTIREEGELMEDPTTSPLLHGSRFVEAITEKDGEIETVPGMLGSPITQTEPDSMETDTPPAVPEKDEPTVTAKSPGITRKPSLPPLFSRRRTSARKISNPWALFRQGSMSNKNKDASRPDDQNVSSPTAETAEVSSPKETGLSKSPFFKAASALLRPGLGIENAKKEKEKEPDVPTSPPVEASQPLPVTDGLIPTRSRQVSSSSIPTATGQPFVVYKHPFNRAVKPAWMQQPAPVWRDPRAYVMTDTDAPIATPMSLEEKEDPIAIKVEEVSQEEEWEVVPPVKAVPLPRRVSDRKPPPPAPARRAEVQFNAFPPRAYPPPVLATNRDSSDESSDTSDTGSNLTADSDTSSDEWSVSDAVPRPPAAYRLLPPKGIPANVLRASNEPPPLPRRNRENRPRPLGPRARGVPPPLPPRLGAGGPAQSVATPSAPAPVTVPVKSVETPVAISAVKQLAAPIQVESGVPTPPAPTRAPPPPPATRPGKPHGLSSRAAKPPPLEIPSSTRPTTGHRTPSGVSTPRINSAKPEDRVRTRSFNGNGLKPLSTTVPLDQPQSSVQPKEYAPLPQAVPFVFSQPKPLRLNNAPLPLFAQSRPKPVHSKTTPNERKGKSRLQIKPRFDDRPEQELKSQLSNRVNKWRLNAVHPDPPELYNPEDDEEEDTQGGGAGGTEGGMSRTVSMPNVLSGVSLQRKEETVKPTVQPVVPMVTVPTAPPPVTQAAPEPTAAETTANTTVTTPSPPNEPRRRTTSRSYAKKPEAGPSSPTAPIVTQPARVQPVTNGSSMAPDANGIEYTDLDLVAAQLQGTDREYEGMHAITSFVGEEVPRGATPDALSNLMLAPVEVESKRTTKDGKTKLKLSALGVRVLKCSVCLSQFKAGDIMAMMPKCGHVGHQRCVVNWLTSDARCMVCREPL